MSHEPPLVAARTFTDSTEFSETISSASVECYQSGDGAFEIEWSGGKTDWLSYELMLLIHGRCFALGRSDDELSVHIPLSLRGDLRLCGEQADPTGFAVYRADDIQSVFGGTYAGLAHLVPSLTEMRRYWEIIHESDFSLDSIACGYINRDLERTEDLRAKMLGLWSLTRTISPQRCPNVVANIGSQIAEDLTRLLGPHQENFYSRGRRPLPRTLIIRRLIAYLDERMAEPITVFDLCAAARISQPTLYRIFQETFDVNPRRFLLLRRLHQVRRRLRTGREEKVTVSSAAMEFGFWQMSRFRSAYRHVFGEPPSETLRRSQRA